MNSTFQSLNKTCFNTTSVKGPIREGDIILSLRVYKYIMGLTYLFDPSDDLRAVLTRDIFVKSNPKAFFLVMHYLFIILDPIDFKQRFYWPLDKNTENIFRTKTVEYLNELNKKHELGLGIVQTYIVVKPYGTKFLTVLLKLLRLVMSEVVRKKQRLANLSDIILNDKNEHFSKQYMFEMNSKSQRLHKQSIKLIKKYTDNTLMLENHSASLKNHLHVLLNMQKSINPNLYSVKTNERDIIELLNHHFIALDSETIRYKEYIAILGKIKLIAHQKINTNSTLLVHFDSVQLQKSTVALDKYNNKSIPDSSTDKIIKSKLSNLFIANKSTINLNDLYILIIFYSSQIKSQFFNHSNVNIKNLEINANVLDQYLIRLKKNATQLTNLKCSINKYKEEVICHSMVGNTKLAIDSNFNSVAALKVNIMMTPRLKWANMNDTAISQSQTIHHPDNTFRSNNNNTILLSALLSSKKLNHSTSKRTRFTDLTENLNLDSSFELQKPTSIKVSLSNKFSKILEKNIKINLNHDQFESPKILLGDPVLISKDRICKSILKNCNINVESEKFKNVNISPTGKYVSTKIVADENVDETIIFNKALYSTIEENIKNRLSYSSSMLRYMSNNSSSEMYKTQITLGGDESHESGLSMLETSETMATQLKCIDKSNNDSLERVIKYPHTVLDTIDLTTSFEKLQLIGSPTSSNKIHVVNENNLNQINIPAYSGNDINISDTSDTCLNDITLLN